MEIMESLKRLWNWRRGQDPTKSCNVINEWMNGWMNEIWVYSLAYSKLGSVLTQISPVQTLPPYICNFHFNIIRQYKPRLSSRPYLSARETLIKSSKTLITIYLHTTSQQHMQDLSSIKYFDMTAESREPERTFIAEQRLGNHVPAITDSNERVAARQQVRSN
jgi:hypothetical protein